MDASDDRTPLASAVHPDDLEASRESTILESTLHDTYRVVRFLAEGGMGRVYEAQHTRISTKRFAIKVLHSELKHSLEVRMRFRREAEAAASIDHPNVVGVHDFGYTPDGRPYLVCDLLEGRDLGDVIRQGGPLSTALTISIGRQLCSALDAAHEKGVIHRDLKPENVFLVGTGLDPLARVLDFGLSRVAELAEASVTQSGMIMGTPGYMSPEQARGERGDTRVDVYGTGAVLYACLTGKPPFTEETPHATVLAVMTREAARPCSIVPTIPAALELVVQKAMAMDPAERYQTMRDLDAALARFDGPGVEIRARQRVPTAPQLEPTALAIGTASDDGEAVGVRRRAVIWLAFGAVVLMVGALSAGLGALAIVAPARPLTPTELVLGVLAVLGSVFTPVLLFLRWIRKNYWNNSARMVNLVAAVRGPVVAGLVLYGLAALCGRALDAMGPRFLDASAPNASGWIGWAPFFFGVAVVAATATSIRQWLLTPNRPGFVRRAAAGPIVVGAAAVGSAAILFTGYEMSGGAPAPVAAKASKEPRAERPGAAPPATSASAAAPPSASAPSKPPPPPPTSSASEPGAKDAAPKQELDAALRNGLQGLLALRTKYPKDPRVLRPLALELGKDKDRASELLRVLDVLFAESAKDVEDKDLGKLVLGAALAPATSQRAIDLMRTRMGLTGADLLFGIVLDHPDVRMRAKTALETGDVQRILSPALKVAYDLYFAPSCSARGDFLSQAAKDGDMRAVTVLTLFVSKPTKGCTKKKPCNPVCPTEAAAMELTIKRIRDRLGK